ncbi:hypothetical protein [Streptomyces cellostaticus]|uniref:hypothetical protein n=1 Tax=Streptomyces TaxID=1883 RepID=UPI00202629DE|nr:hypothetical protein [Streptomyces cellostaticus]
MSKRARTLPRIESERCGARLPSRGTARAPAVRPQNGRATRESRGAAGEWMLLPGGTWRRVRTIRVPSLFG